MGRNWSELIKRHPKHAQLRADEVYALPPGLIDSLESKRLFSRTEAKFERDLAQFSGVGFREKQLISFPLLRWHDVTVLDAKSIRAHKRALASGAKIREMIEIGLRRVVKSDRQIAQIEDRQQAVVERVRERQRGYVGWLLTDSGFRHDRDRLRRLWRLRPDARSNMPRLTLELFGERRTRPPDEMAESEDEATKFLWKWGLAGMETWELPVPLDPSFVDPSLHSITDQESAGAVLFVPWHQLVERNMRLDEVLDLRRMSTPLTHLDGWLRSRTAKGWSFRRFGTMLQLYVCLHLAINARYPDQRCGEVVLLDEAFARFFSGSQDAELAEIRSVDSVRKVRSEMERRLRESRTNN